MTNEEHKAWLSTLKVGDKVCVPTRNAWSGSQFTVYKIERVTATQLVSSRPQTLRSVEIRFRRSDGRIVGESRYAKIEPVTDKVREVNERHKLEQWASYLKPKDLSTACLRAMKEAYDKNGGAA